MIETQLNITLQGDAEWLAKQVSPVIQRKIIKRLLQQTAGRDTLVCCEREMRLLVKHQRTFTLSQVQHTLWWLALRHHWKLLAIPLTACGVEIGFEIPRITLSDVSA